MNSLQQQTHTFRRSLILLLCLLLCPIHLAHSETFHNPLTKIVSEQTSVKCMIENCLECQQNMPYTCKTCQQSKTCCSLYCKNCTLTSPTVCIQCQENYLYNQTSKACVLQNSYSQKYCFQYDNQTKQCQSCIARFVLNPYTLTCMPCQRGCSSCNITMDCESCDAHWFLKDTNCQECDSICQTCENISTNCNSCSSQTYLNNHTCLKCMQHCALCTEAETCMKCDYDYYLDNKTKTCAPCGQYCLSCTSLTQCTQCHQEYYLNQTTKFCYTCEEHIPGCMNCIELRSDSSQSQKIVQMKNLTSNVRCIKCQQGYLNVNKTQCKPCITHCLNCLTLTDCSNCENGYFYNQDTKKCVTCQISGCMVCKTQTQCSMCNKGYFWNNISLPEYPFCDRCKVGCITCGINYCNTCDNGYYLANNTCLKCNIECMQCIGQPDKCIVCALGYFIVDNSWKCVKCSENCLRCNAKDACTDCAIGFRYQNKTCIKCSIQNCGYCKKNQTSSETCIQCISKNFLKNNMCVPCIERCLTCSQQNKCISCNQGYYLQEETSVCKKCQQNCIECIVDNDWHVSCIKCQSNFYIDESKHCQHCTTVNCHQCSGQLCYRCNIGFYVVPDKNQCDRCQENCIECIDGTNCINCVQGFYLKNYLCLKCADGCVICNNDVNCTVCSHGFRLDQASNVCQACKSVSCVSCSGNVNLCNQCYPGFVLENTTQLISAKSEKNSTSLCFKCGENILQGCKSCLSSKICYECINGYKLNDSNLCEAQTYKIWPYVLVICLLAGSILLIAGLKLKKKIEKGKSLSQILKISKKSTKPQNYHKLEELSIN